MKALVKKRSGSLRHIVILLVAAFMVVFQSLTFLTSFLPISSAACWATPGWTSSSWGGSSGGRRRARWSAGTQGSSKFLAEIWTRLNCLHRSFLSIGQIFSLFLVLPLLLRSAFTFFLCVFHIMYSILHQRFLKLHDMTIVLLAGCSMLTQALLYFFATSTKFILATVFFNLLAVLWSQPLRSSMTKIVGEGIMVSSFDMLKQTS